jgi:hypothetical protein
MSCSAQPRGHADGIRRGHEKSPATTEKVTGLWGVRRPGQDGATQAWHTRRLWSWYLLAIAASMSGNIP